MRSYLIGALIGSALAEKFGVVLDSKQDDGPLRMGNIAPKMDKDEFEGHTACKNSAIRNLEEDVSELADGTIKTVTVYKCMDGTTETKTKTKKKTTKKKIEKVKISEFQANIDFDTFILHNYNEKSPKGWMKVDMQMLSQDIWGYFAYYYSVYGGVHSFGFDGPVKNQICIDQMGELLLGHAAQPEDSWITIAEEYQDENGESIAKPEGSYPICSSSDNSADSCWSSDDAVDFRSTSSLVLDRNTGCPRGLALAIKVEWLDQNKIEYRGKKDPNNPNPGPPSKCKKNGTCKDELKPTNIFIGGKRIKISANTFILGDDEIINHTKYIIVTPKMLINGMWDIFKDIFYSKFQGLASQDWVDTGAVCLGKGFRIENVDKNVHDAADEIKDAANTYSEKYAVDPPGVNKFQICQGGTCYNSVDDWMLSRPDFGVSEGTCGGRYNLYVYMRVYDALRETWDENVEETFDLIKTDTTTMAPTTTPEFVETTEVVVVDTTPEIDVETTPEIVDETTPEINVVDTTPAGPDSPDLTTPFQITTPEDPEEPEIDYEECCSAVSSNIDLDTLSSAQNDLEQQLNDIFNDDSDINDTIMESYKYVNNMQKVYDDDNCSKYQAEVDGLNQAEAGNIKAYMEQLTVAVQVLKGSSCCQA